MTLVDEGAMSSLFNLKNINETKKFYAACGKMMENKYMDPVRMLVGTCVLSNSNYLSEELRPLNS